MGERVVIRDVVRAGGGGGGGGGELVFPDGTFRFIDPDHAEEFLTEYLTLIGTPPEAIPGAIANVMPLLEAVVGDVGQPTSTTAALKVLDQMIGSASAGLISIGGGLEYVAAALNALPGGAELINLATVEIESVQFREVAIDPAFLSHVCVPQDLADGDKVLLSLPEANEDSQVHEAFVLLGESDPAVELYFRVGPSGTPIPMPGSVYQTMAGGLALQARLVAMPGEFLGLEGGFAFLPRSSEQVRRGKMDAYIDDLGDGAGLVGAARGRTAAAALYVDVDGYDDITIELATLINTIPFKLVLTNASALTALAFRSIDEPGSPFNASSQIAGAMQGNDLVALVFNGPEANQLTLTPVGGGGGTAEPVFRRLWSGRVVDSSLDLSGGDFSDIPLVDPDGNASGTVARSGRVGMGAIVMDGDDFGFWIITESGPCDRPEDQPLAGEMLVALSTAWADFPYVLMGDVGENPDETPGTATIYRWVNRLDAGYARFDYAAAPGVNGTPGTVQLALQQVFARLEDLET